jgi:hypothetical protein
MIPASSATILPDGFGRRAEHLVQAPRSSIAESEGLQ